MQAAMLSFPYSLTCSSFVNASGTPSPPACESLSLPPSPSPSSPHVLHHPMAQQGTMCHKSTSATGRVFPSIVRKSTAFTIEAILGLDNCIVQQQIHSSTPGERTYRTSYGLTASNDHFDALHPCSLSPDSTRKLERNKVARNSRTQSSDSTNVETHIHHNKMNCGKSKRVRTIFTPEQLDKLEREFERQQYMVGPERLYLASALNLTEAQVKVWFQNRRIKWRKQHLELQQARLAKIRRESGDYDTEDGIDHHDALDSSSPNGHEF